MRSFAPLLLAALVLSCGSRAGSAGPTPSVGPVALTAQGESMGVTLRLDLDRAALRVGEVVWATVTIENTSDQTVQWIGGGCNVPGHVAARIPALAEYGRSWDYPFAELKKRLAIAAAPGYIPLVDEASWAARAQGGRACTADVRANDLAPRGKLLSRFAWDGTLPGGAPAPTGEVAITASLDMNDWKSMTGKSVGATVTLPLSGGAATRVSPGQALDAAFEDPRFAAWVRPRFVARGNSEPAAYDVNGGVRLDGDTWIISATQKTAPAGEIEVRVSALDGTVRSVVER